MILLIYICSINLEGDNELDNLINNFHNILRPNNQIIEDLVNMANPNYQLIRYQADNIPNFDGNTKTLGRFITSCEHFLQNHQNRQNAADPINVCLFDTVICKLTGRAAELIASRTELDTWQKIKDSLIVTFSDQRTEDCLVQDIINMKPDRNDSLHSFGLKLQDSRSLLFAKINSSNDPANMKILKIEQFDNLCLKTFINNLSYHMQLVVRLKDPDSLEQALAFVREEENFIQYKNKSNLNSRNMPTNNTNNKNKPQSNNATGYYPANIQRMPMTPFNNNLFYRPNNPFNNQNFVRPNLFTNNFARSPNMPFNNQFARPQNFNNFNRPFQRPNVNPNNNAPEPMDTSSGITVRPNTVQRSRLNNFIVQELSNQATNTVSPDTIAETPTQESNIDANSIPNNDNNQFDFSNYYQPPNSEMINPYNVPYDYMYNMYDNTDGNNDYETNIDDSQYQNFQITPNYPNVT